MPMIFLEFYVNQNIAYAFKKNFDEFKPDFNYEIVKEYNDTIVLRIENKEFFTKEYFVTDYIKGFKCFCGNDFNINSFNKLPSKNWKELIGLFSCHDNEFKVLEKRIFLPRENGILYDDFSFFIRKNKIPICCKRKLNEENSDIVRIFFHQVQSKNNLNVEMIYFLFLNEHFKTKSTLTLENIEIKFLGDVFIYKNDGFSYAKKVMYKKLENFNKINEIERLFLEILTKNDIEMGIKEYNMSYIMAID